MNPKWNPVKTERLIKEIDSEIYKQKLEELAELIYDAFCELHKNRSVESKLKNSCDEQELRKAG